MVIDLGLPKNFGAAMRAAVRQQGGGSVSRDYPMVPGSRTVVYELEGYKLVQNRPFKCRYTCQCGECDGHTVAYPGTVVQTIYFADNSIETVVQCDDGQKRYIRHVAPHGDLCF